MERNHCAGGGSSKSPRIGEESPDGWTMQRKTGTLKPASTRLKNSAMKNITLSSISRHGKGNFVALVIPKVKSRGAPEIRSEISWEKTIWTEETIKRDRPTISIQKRKKESAFLPVGGSQSKPQDSLRIRDQLPQLGKGDRTTSRAETPPI